MNFVVDTNIVFSAILNTNSHIAGLLTDHTQDINYFSPTFLLTELAEHRVRLESMLKIGSQEVLEIQHLVTQNIHFVNESQISAGNWIQAEKLTFHIDCDDIAFVALSLELKCPLWTGDKKLHRNIKELEILTTEQIAELVKG